MIVAAHQPIFLPWPGFFHKAAHADCLVLLDAVQFPRGRTWLTHNRLKNETGEMWLTVPVLRKGRGLQTVRRVEIYEEREWRRKHIGGIQQNYVHAPYFPDYFPRIEAVYRKRHKCLSDFTTELIMLQLDALSLRAKVLRQSEMGIEDKGTELLIRICRHLGADRFLSLSSAEKHIDGDSMRQSGIEIIRSNFRPPVYPQLWGDFIYNLSALDMLLNCGPKSRDIMFGGIAA